VSDDFQAWYQEHYPTDLADTSYRWHPANPVEVLYRHQRERAVVWALSKIDRRLNEIDVLDVGCGDGKPLRFLLELGADINRAIGIDLIVDRVESARRVNPGMQLRVGNAGEGLPWPDASFDLVTQFVAFSSMPEAEIRQQAAREMARVCRPGGFLLWYDITYRKPGRIPDGIARGDVLGLFPGFDQVAARALHVLGINRLAGHPALAAVVEATPLLPRTNLILVARHTR
jgi:SAM-dependent methyltransferase